MPKKQSNITEKEIEGIFFEAMCAGYASEQKIQKQQIPELPGYKCIEFIRGNFRVLDAYCVHPFSDKSYGSTTIWHNGAPVWVMHYGGQYPEECISFLKEALLVSYQMQQFNGGRGPLHYNCMYNEHLKYLIAHPKYRYINDVASNSSFAAFAGKECIKNRPDPFRDDKIFGWHHYFGGLMI